jgi:hypothetical protein
MNRIRERIKTADEGLEILFIKSGRWSTGFFHIFGNRIGKIVNIKDAYQDINKV